MRVEIRSVQNGAILRIEGDAPGAGAEEVVNQETESAEVEAFADFLCYLVDHCGPATSRYSPKRICLCLCPLPLGPSSSRRGGPARMHRV